jgi:hypothetical protein
MFEINKLLMALLALYLIAFWGGMQTRDEPITEIAD